MPWNVRRVALFSAGLFLLASPLRPDALVITQAMKAATVAEIFIEEDAIRVELQIGVDVRESAPR